MAGTSKIEWTDQTWNPLEPHCGLLHRLARLHGNDRCNLKARANLPEPSSKIVPFPSEPLQTRAFSLALAFVFSAKPTRAGDNAQRKPYLAFAAQRERRLRHKCRGQTHLNLAATAWRSALPMPRTAIATTC